MRPVVLDPGHGGHDSGALSPTGLKESDVVLRITTIMGEILSQHGVPVVHTRTSDVFLELDQRAQIANHNNASLFFSVHCNSAEREGATGHEVFTSPGETLSDKAATAAFLRYNARFPDLKARVDLGDGDPDKEAKFRVLTATRGAAVLYETEFIHNDHGDTWFRDGRNIRGAAEALAYGILDYLGIPVRDEATPAPVAVVPPQEEPLPSGWHEPDGDRKTRARAHAERIQELLS